MLGHLKRKTENGSPEWLMTFGDLMSLLLTFFILLYSMSEVKENDRFQEAIESLRKTFGSDASLLAVLPGELAAHGDFQSVAAAARARRDTMLRESGQRNFNSDQNRGALLIDESNPLTAGTVIFETGSDRLTDKSKAILEEVYARIAGMPQRIEITGHTSNHPLPKNAQFKDHWDLAYARSSKVKNFLIHLGIKPRRIRIGVAAGNELKYTGIDPIQQKRNPRVEVRLLNDTISTEQGKESGGR
jgi:chemotaxis protein MotB